MRRRFLGWKRPGLPATADYLLERFSSGRTIDLSEVVVALPGARAGRRLLEILVDRAAREGLELAPPRILTTGALPELLYEAERPAAGELLQLLVWREVLEAADPGDLERLLAGSPPPGDFEGWLGVAELLRKLHVELAGERLDMAEVAEKAPCLEGFIERERWLALARLEQSYLDRIDELGWSDPQHARLEAISRGRCRAPGELVLVGAADVGGALRAMLDQVAERVSVLVFAPESRADRFDRYGRVVEEKWTKALVDIPADAVVVADDPGDQAAAVIGAIGALGGRRAAEEITVGVPDDDVVPHLEQAMRRAGLPLHLAAGSPASRSRPCRLLEAIGDWIDRGRFRDLAALVRHPDVELRLRRPVRGRRAGSAPARDGLALLDRYLSDHLQEKVSDHWLGPTGRGEALERLRRSVERLSRGLQGPPRPLREWAAPLLELLVEVYDPALRDRSDREARHELEALSAVHATLREIHGLDPRASSEVGAPDAIRLVTARLGRVALPQPPARESVEALGWLELLLDDAPALVVTGFNEGYVPASVGADPFLPESLRRHFGLTDNGRRYARDAYALSAILASRDDVRFVVGRRRADGDPLTPSRLLFACDREELPARVRAVFAAPGAGRSRAAGLHPGKAVLDFPFPPAETSEDPPESLRVSAFRDYLICPYGFYLRHVLRLRSLDDAAEELDPARFGTLAHDVLQDFGSGPDAASSDDGEISRALDAALARRVAERYGGSPHPAVLVQIEQLRARLHAFASWQAARASEGWRIEHTEVAVDCAVLEVDGKPMGLRGRIDRIDRHDDSGERVLFDYKTSETGRTPEETHRARGGEWIDLQLPLYRFLARSRPLELEGPVKLGYIVLPKDTHRTKHHIAGWDESDLAAAEEKARWVVRQVREGRFEPADGPLSPLLREYAPIYREGLILAEAGDPANGDNGVVEP